MASHTRRPGTGPRQAEHLYRVVLEELRDNGFDEVAIETVAQRAGVNKTTIYRWWPSKDALVADALVHSELLELDVPDTGSLRGDLVELVEQVRLLLSGPDTAPIATSVFAAAASRPELAGLTRDFFADRLSRERVIFERAIARGDIHPDTDIMLAVDMALGAVWTRIVLRQHEVGEAFDVEVADMLLAALALR